MKKLNIFLISATMMVLLGVTGCTQLDTQVKEVETIEDRMVRISSELNEAKEMLLTKNTDIETDELDKESVSDISNEKISLEQYEEALTTLNNIGANNSLNINYDIIEILKNNITTEAYKEYYDSLVIKLDKVKEKVALGDDTMDGLLENINTDVSAIGQFARSGQIYNSALEDLKNVQLDLESNYNNLNSSILTNLKEEIEQIEEKLLSKIKETEEMVELLEPLSGEYWYYYYEPYTD